MTAPTPPAIEGFFCYAHEDENLRDRLAKHLKLLEREHVIKVWHDHQIQPGTEWQGQLDQHLETAQIILLLISADFLASDYCYDIEMTRALERHNAGAARVIPIILRPVDNWDKSPFGKLQALPKGGKPITRWQNEDEAFVNVVKGIRAVVATFISSVTLPNETQPPVVLTPPSVTLPNETQPQTRDWARIWLLPSVVAVGVAGVVVANSPHFMNQPIDRNAKGDGFSFGEESLIERNPSAPPLGKEKEGRSKQDGMDALRNGQNKEAFDIFYDLRNKYKKDPEILIYLNNAKSRKYASDKGIKLHTIAVVAPFDQEPGMNILFGVAQAQNEIVKGIVMDPKRLPNGIDEAPELPLEILLADDKSNVEQAKTISKKLAADKSVSAVVGHYSSETTLEALDAYQSAGLVDVSPGSTSLELTKKRKDYPKPVFFRTVSSTQLEGKRLAEYIGSIGAKKIVVFYYSNHEKGYSASIKQQFIENLLHTIDKDNIKVLDLSNAIDSASQKIKVEALKEIKKADAVAVFPPGDTTEKSFQSAENLIKYIVEDKSLKVKPILAAHSLITWKTLYRSTISQDVLDFQNKLKCRLFIAADWVSSNSDSFTTESDAYWGGGINWKTTRAYDALRVVADALKKLGISGNMRDALRQELAGFTSLTGASPQKSISFDGNGDRAEIKERTLVTVFPPESSQTSVLAPSNQCKDEEYQNRE